MSYAGGDYRLLLPMLQVAHRVWRLSGVEVPPLLMGIM